MENESEMTGTSTFTSQDREKLTTLSVDMGYMKEAFQRLESALISDRNKASDHHDGIEERIRAIEERFEEKLQSVKEQYDARVLSLEQFRWWILGAAGTAGVVAGLLGRALFLHS